MMCVWPPHTILTSPSYPSSVLYITNWKWLFFFPYNTGHIIIRWVRKGCTRWILGNFQYSLGNPENHIWSDSGRNPVFSGTVCWGYTASTAKQTLQFALSAHQAALWILLPNLLSLPTLRSHAPATLHHSPQRELHTIGISWLNVFRTQCQRHLICDVSARSTGLTAQGLTASL